MNNISLSDLFSKKLKSPLLNARWSWGAINANNAVVLRVFQHEFEKEMFIFIANYGRIAWGRPSAKIMWT
jgi:hypothetical protein